MATPPGTFSAIAHLKLTMATYVHFAVAEVENTHADHEPGFLLFRPD
jgi:hypothetical protein